MSYIKTIRHYRLLSLHIASFHFNPGIVSSLVTVALLYVMVSLGFWQADRAEFKETLQLQLEQRKTLTPVDLKELSANDENRRYQPIIIAGEYDADHSLLLDNITFDRKVGYHVFTPFKIEGSKAILVIRGFTVQGKTRQQLPEITAPDGKIEVRGLLDNTPSKTLVLAENVQETSRWPVVLQYIDLEEIKQLLGYELYDMVLWLAPDETGSFEYDLPALNLNAAKNYGYAFQWFAMSLALFIIYIVVNTKKNKSKRL